MDPVVTLAIIRAIFSGSDLRSWLQSQAMSSTTPLDNLALKVLYTLLDCED